MEFFFDDRQILTCQKQRKKRCIKRADILKLHSNKKWRRIPKWLINSKDKLKKLFHSMLDRIPRVTKRCMRIKIY